MLHLLMPDCSVKWINVPATTFIEIADKYGSDLARLAWEPSERRADVSLIRWALRHGVPCSVGMVLHSPELTVLDEPDFLRGTLGKRNQSRDSVERLADDDEYAKELDLQVNEILANSIADAEEERAEALAMEAKADLIQHWRRLGGPLPKPV